ncbi:MAG: aldehyde ferredoxin oxidoreductase family protein [Anaerolineae bacterium]|nr:aldehyde ferredoxin oxidoreductase family protein [Anaerolineae bacterium]
MAYGYHGKILHVDLTAGTLAVEEPEESFYRKYLGGSAMGAYYLWKHTPPGSDPLGPENTLSLMLSVITGAPISGQSRLAATAKSPLSGLADESTAGGFWPAELKFAGYDGIVIRGKSERPVYLWVHDGEAELRDATHLLGRFTADVEDAIREELGETRAQVLQCGPSAEAGVPFGVLINNANRVNGRGGMGTVMASKNLKAVVVRGRDRPEIADPDALQALARWGAEHVDESGVSGFKRLGTAVLIAAQSRVGGLPTRNWTSGTFEGAEAIGGERMAETILQRNDTCYACAVRCKRVVEVTEGPFRVDPRYGGPEYETIGTMGSYCGVDDLAAIARAHQLCDMYGIDTITCGATIAWAMECFERGLIDLEDTEGIELRFGNAHALVQMVELIAKREGFGRVLSEGSVRAAKALGVGEDLVVAVKGRELPAHMPQTKRTMALVYAVNPGGADHTVYEHDTSYARFPERMAEIGLLDPQPPQVLNAEMVRYSLYSQWAISSQECLCTCKFVFGPAWQLYSASQMVEAVRAVTGWQVTLWELMKAGERRLNLLRAFNAREGVGGEADTMPAKMEVPLQGGPTDGLAVTREEFESAKALFYGMAGWDEQGRPTRPKLEELGLGWVADELALR